MCYISNDKIKQQSGKNSLVSSTRQTSRMMSRNCDTLIYRANEMNFQSQEYKAKENIRGVSFDDEFAVAASRNCKQKSQNRKKRVCLSINSVGCCSSVAILVSPSTSYYSRNRSFCHSSSPCLCSRHPVVSFVILI